MKKKILLTLLALPLVAVLLLAIVLFPGHRQIRQVEPALPAPQEILSALQVSAGATAIRYVNTATQSGPLGTIGHLGVLIQWPDGRRFLIDTGMAPDVAVAFGAPMETLLDAQPTATFGALDVQIGEAVQSIAGMAFTHLHSDHTDGLTAICAAQNSPATIYQTTDQSKLHNNSTAPGQLLIEGSACDKATLTQQRVMPVPGFPGLLAIAAGGHTPGSTVYAVRVGNHNWIFAGDITNDMQSLHDNVGKGWLYSTLLVPEHTDWLAQLRPWLESIDQDDHSSVLVAHDIGAFEQSSIAAWGS